MSTTKEPTDGIKFNKELLKNLEDFDKDPNALHGITDEEVKEKPSLEKVRSVWNENFKNIRFPSPKPSRVVDMYNRKDLNDHLARFAQHCAAKGIQPTMEVIIDWLYSEKAFDERDDFVKIERLMQMVGNGQVYPLLIMEVLDYAKKVEKAAIAVNDELGHLSGSFESLKELREALDVRLKVREKDEQKDKPTE